VAEWRWKDRRRGLTDTAKAEQDASPDQQSDTTCVGCLVMSPLLICATESEMVKLDIHKQQ
jgi:hypothetical protein